MKKLYIVLGAIAVSIAIPLGIVFFGLVNVAASKPENALVEWVLSTAMKQSVNAHSRDLHAPDLADKLRIREGLSQYASMCVVCHGAPGVKPSVFSRGLNPPPPILSEEEDEWESRELFWITKHGVKMTGMPGFGHAHSDEEIWDIVAFLQQIPKMSPKEYASELQVAGPHSHDSTSEAHEPEEDASTAHEDHDDSPSETHGDHDNGHSEDHEARDEALTQDESHEDHDHSADKPRHEDEEDHDQHGDP